MDNLALKTDMTVPIAELETFSFKFLRGHSNRVSKLSVLLGKQLGLPMKDLQKLKSGGFFHDVGKIGVPMDIILKTGKLTDDEYLKMREHPSIGAKLLSSDVSFKNIIPIVKHHHERYDGTGYPDRLQGENIPYLARIAAIADAFDAMTSRRSYRAPLDLDIIIEEFEKNKGTQFDPTLTDVFLNIINTDVESINEIRKKY